jgi:hypothetical protein
VEDRVRDRPPRCIVATMHPSPPSPVQIDTIGPWTAYVAPLAAAAGLRHDRRAEVVLHVTDLPDDCRRADPWVVDSRPHLTVVVVPDAVRVGPFVVPGVTACLRCVRAWSAAGSLGGSVGRGPAGAPLVPGPGLDPALLALGVGWAARDVATWLDGGTPSTWSATVTLGLELSPARRTWHRHPHCGCSWGEAV